MIELVCAGVDVLDFFKFSWHGQAELDERYTLSGSCNDRLLLSYTIGLLLTVSGNRKDSLTRPYMGFVCPTCCMRKTEVVFPMSVDTWISSARSGIVSSFSSQASPGNFVSSQDTRFTTQLR